jgi:hypothetical protein
MPTRIPIGECYVFGILIEGRLLERGLFLAQEQLCGGESSCRQFASNFGNLLSAWGYALARLTRCEEHRGLAET